MTELWTTEQRLALLRKVYDENIAAARAQAADSVDPSTRVGGLLGTTSGFSVEGRNTFATMNAAQARAASREERYADVIHAEEVILLHAGKAAVGGVYVGTHEPCGRCWRRMIYCGISGVAFARTDDERRARWGCAEGRALAEAAGILVLEVVE